MDKLISIIVPCYNASLYLYKCIDSLVNQTIGIENLELIFINDASTDNTLKILLHLERKYPDSVLIIDQATNFRQGSARNLGLTYATGKYIAFVDADDWIDTSMCQKLYTLMEQGGFDLVQFCFKRVYDSSFVLNDTKTGYESMVYTIDSTEERKDFLISELIDYGCWNKLYRHSIINKCNARFGENVICEEPLFVYPLLFEIKSFCIFEEFLYFYRQNPNGSMIIETSNNNKMFDQLKVQYAVYNKMKDSPYFGDFYHEIEIYFIHTYFIETILSSRRKDHIIDISVFEIMRETINKCFPDYLNNPYMIDDENKVMITILEPINNILSQDELDHYTSMVYKIWYL